MEVIVVLELHLFSLDTYVLVRHCICRYPISNFELVIGLVGMFCRACPTSTLAPLLRVSLCETIVIVITYHTFQESLSFEFRLQSPNSLYTKRTSSGSHLSN
jgi:hypothetical protein